MKDNQEASELGKGAPADSGRCETAEDRMLRAVGEYLEEKGWSVLVVSAERVERAALPHLHPNTYEFVLRFTGGPR